MTKATIPLDVIQIASPCPVSWDAMQGNNRVRFCGQCQLNVYNLSEMTRDEAETLVNSHEGRLCAGFYQRADGTVLTRECPVGLRAVRVRIGKMLAASAAMLVALISGTVFARQERARIQSNSPFSFLAAKNPITTVARWVGMGPNLRAHSFISGMICLPNNSAGAPGPSSTTPTETEGAPIEP